MLDAFAAIRTRASGVCAVMPNMAAPARRTSTITCAIISCSIRRLLRRHWQRQNGTGGDPGRAYDFATDYPQEIRGREVVRVSSTISANSDRPAKQFIRQCRCIAERAVHSPRGVSLRRRRPRTQPRSLMSAPRWVETKSASIEGDRGCISLFSRLRRLRFWRRSAHMRRAGPPSAQSTSSCR